MMRPATCLYIFARHAEQPPLPSLQQEQSGVQDALRPLEKENLVHCEFSSATDVDRLFKLSKAHFNHLSILHFSGHSDDAHIGLQDNNLRAVQLATMLGLHEQLQLVFLNSCRSRAQAKLLIDKGVNTIITTSGEVSDKIAAALAIHFYEALAAGMSIGQAFKSAQNEVNARHSDAAITGETRGLVSPKDYDPDSPFTWELRYKDKEELNWRLPEHPVPLVPMQNAIIVDESANLHIIDALVSGLSGHLPEEERDELVATWDDILDENTPTIFHDIRTKLFSLLPVPLPTYLSDLTQEVTNPRERLQIILSLYQSLGQLLAYILLSDFWQLIWEGNAERLAIPDAYHQAIEQYFAVAQTAEKDHYGLLIDLCFLLEYNDLTAASSVPELIQFGRQLSQNSRLFSSYRYLEDNAAVLGEAERCLAQLLAATAFLCRYQLVSVSDISVIKTLKAPVPTYRLQYANLVGEKVGFRNGAVAPEAFPCNHAVLLKRKTSPGYESAIFLSPFLMDKNVFLKFHAPGDSRDSDLFFLQQINLAQGLRYRRAINLDDTVDIPLTIAGRIPGIRQGHQLYNHNAKGLAHLLALSREFFGDLQVHLNV